MSSSACTIALLSTLSIFSLFQVFSHDTFRYDTRLEAFESNFFLQAFLSVTMGVVFLVALSYMGTLVNDELQLHR